MRNVHIAAAVAAALGLGSTALAAAPPTPSGAMQATVNIYMAGSSAAVNGVLAFIEGSAVCGGTGFSLFTTPTSTPGLPDFRAVSCTAAAGSFSGETITVWYRPEGGSVVGVFPTYHNIGIKQLNISSAGCVLNSQGSNATSAVYSCASVAGTTPGNGTDDSFGTGTFAHTVDIGVSDLEPAVFGNPTIGSTKNWAGGGNDDPVGTYASAFTGADLSVSTLNGATWNHNIVFQQVFGFVVNNNLGISDLPKEQIAAIFDGEVTDWSQVPSGTSSTGTVAAASTPIVVCNREIGSGTRGSTDVFLNGDGCDVPGSVIPLADVAGSTVGSVTEPADNFATLLELDCVNKNPNSIGYASIDNSSKIGAGTSEPNVKFITVSTVAASQLNGALGVYSYVYEASLNENPANKGTNNNADTFYKSAWQTLQAQATTAKSGQVLAIPGLQSNPTSMPLTQVAPSNEFTSLFTRGGNSCTPLQGP
jgi:ABC-type phosphate transport system substrate-binding protein